MFFVIPGAQGPLMLHSDLEAGVFRFPSSPSGVAHVLTKKKSRDFNVVGLVFFFCISSLACPDCGVPRLPLPPRLQGVLGRGFDLRAAQKEREQVFKNSNLSFKK